MFSLEAMNVVSASRPGEASEDMIAPLVEASRRAYLRWGDTQGARVPKPYDDGPSARLITSFAMRQRRAPGNTCLAAVSSGANGTTQQPINDSKGCGAVMRTAPLGLQDSRDPWVQMQLGCQTGALTHGHVDGWLPAGMMAALVRYLMAGETLEHGVEQVLPLSIHRAMSDGHGSQIKLVLPWIWRVSSALRRALLRAWVRDGRGTKPWRFLYMLR